VPEFRRRLNDDRAENPELAEPVSHDVSRDLSDRCAVSSGVSDPRESARPAAAQPGRV
jgi:hypothetical protein